MSASRQIRFRAMNFLPRTLSIELQSIGGRPERASFRTVELRRPSEPALGPFAPLRTVLSVAKELRVTPRRCGTCRS